MSEVNQAVNEGERTLYLSNHLQATGRRKRYRARLIKAGRIRGADGDPGHLIVGAEAIKAAVAEGLFEGLACFVDHPDRGRHGSVRDLLGTWHEARYDPAGRSAEAVLRVYENARTRPVIDTLDAILSDAAQGGPAPDVGVSLVFYPQFAENLNGQGPPVVRRFRKVESADIVFSPAADGRILEALSNLVGGDPSMSEVTVNDQTSAEGVNEFIDPQAAGTNPSSSQARGIEGGRGQRPEEAVPQRWLDSMAQAAATAVESRLAPIFEEQVIELGERPVERTNGVRRASLDVENAVYWMFGAPLARIPEPELRDTARVYTLLTGDTHWRGVFDGRQALASASVTTLADLAVDAMNKVIIATWDALATYRWFEQVVVVQPNDGSLQDVKWLQFGGIADLPVVSEGSAYTEATVVDSKEADSFTKYGVYVGITRKMLRNSEVARMQAIPRALAVSALRTRESKIAGIFTSNSGVGPTLDDDSTPLFHANHSNLATTAFSYSGWAAARTECYKQTEAGSSKRLGFWPRFWLGPADLYDTALEIFGYGAGPGGKPGTSNNDVNPYGEARPGDPRPIPLAVPSFTDANDWAYIVDPNVQPIIQMSYAQSPGGRSHPLPELFTVVSETAGLMFTNDTMPIKVRDEFAYGVSGYRGIGKRNVA